MPHTWSRTLRPLLLPPLLLILFLLPFVWGLITSSLVGHKQTVISSAGIIQDEQGAPIAGAVVRFKGDPEYVLSDADGHYELPQEKRIFGPITAWREGYLIANGYPIETDIKAGRASVDITLKRLPSEDAPDYEWVDPAPNAAGTHNCANCHAEMYREWAGSGHARSATGPHFRNLYEGTDAKGRADVGWGLLTQYPEGSGVCTSCHAPSVRPGDPASFDLREVSGVAARGVHCDYCHKIVDAPLTRSDRNARGKLGTTHGRDGLTLLRPAKEQLFFGPLDDVDRGEDSFVPLYRQSGYCASCHEGVVFGVHVYGTYSEWLASPARREGKECQNCHMTPTGKMTNFAPGKEGIERDPQSLASHHMPGGTAEMLKRCLTLSVTLKPAAEEVRAAVELSADQVGHRVPTGFIDRNLVLAVEAIDAIGKRLAAKEGPVLPAAAGRDLEGQPGRLHAKLLLDKDGKTPAPFWKRETEPIDTRLSPGKVERSEFVFGSEVRRVRVRLIYRRFWASVAEVKGWTDNDLVLVDRTFDLVPGRTTRWSNR